MGIFKDCEEMTQEERDEIYQRINKELREVLEKEGHNAAEGLQHKYMDERLKETSLGSQVHSAVQGQLSPGEVDAYSFWTVQAEIENNFM